MSVKLLTEHHLEFQSLTGGCPGSSESIRVKMPHCWKSHVTFRADLFCVLYSSPIFILFTYSIPAESIYFHSVSKTDDPDQMASPKASLSGSTVFSKKDKSGFSRAMVSSKISTIII